MLRTSISESIFDRNDRCVHAVRSNVAEPAAYGVETAESGRSHSSSPVRRAALTRARMLRQTAADGNDNC